MLKYKRRETWKENVPYLHLLYSNNTLKLEFILVSTYAATPVRILRYAQEDRPEQLKAAIVAEFQRRGEPPLFCETSGNVTVIVFESYDENWYRTARAVRHAFNTNP